MFAWMARLIMRPLGGNAPPLPGGTAVVPILITYATPAVLHTSSTVPPLITVATPATRR